MARRVSFYLTSGPSVIGSFPPRLSFGIRYTLWAFLQFSGFQQMCISGGSGHRRFDTGSSHSNARVLCVLNMADEQVSEAANDEEPFPTRSRPESAPRFSASGRFISSPSAERYTLPAIVRSNLEFLAGEDGQSRSSVVEELLRLDQDPQPEEEQFISTVQEDEIDIYGVLPEELRSPVKQPSISISDGILPYPGYPGGYGIDASNSDRIRETYKVVSDYLKESSGDAPSVYDRLKQSVRHILKTSNKNAYDGYEQILDSAYQQFVDRRAGNAKFHDAEIAESKLRTEVLKAEGAIDERIDAFVDEETGKSKLPNILRLYPYLSNVGIPRLFSTDVACLLNSAVKKLLDADAKIITIKFWGIIYGQQNDYYVLEADADPPDDEEEEPEEEPAEGEEEEAEQPEIEGFENLPPIPKPMLKPLPPLVKEPTGSGVNRKSYYVATKLDGNWTRLPAVIPEQVIIARKIDRGFTGNLAAKVPSFPVFPGTELNYLRAQIARISGSTQICPVGYFMLDSEEEAEEGAPPPFTLTDNPDYKAPSFQELSQPHMKSWIHHNQFILRQGRTFFYDAFEANKDEDEEEEEPEDEEEGVKVRKPKYPVWYPEKADWYEPEATVPPPLASVINDAAIDGYPPWSLHFGSHAFPSQSFIVARSNLWPGSYTVVYDGGKNFFNMYFGNGVKYRSNFVPTLPLHVKHEKYDPTLHEELDPTPEEEEEIRKAAGLDNDEEGGEGDEDEEDQ